MNRILPGLADGDSGTVTTVVIGAGHAGLAVSQCLSARSIDHIVLEGGEVANSWKTERWDSLRLLTPNWQNRLPGGYFYQGCDPDGFMTMPEIADFIGDYARSFSAPVKTATRVIAVHKTDYGYHIQTNTGQWRCRSLVLASGSCNKPNIPAMAQALPSSVHSLHPMEYRNPAQLGRGNVLVVGASASGLQLAQEIRKTGREVTLAVGEHVRMPRTYRGLDIQWWMHASGILDRDIADEDDVQRARRVPSPQLIGSPARDTLDLNTLTDAGVSIVGRMSAIREGKALFSGALRNSCALADLKLNRLLDSFDEFASTHSEVPAMGAPERMSATRVPDRPKLKIDFAQETIDTVIWATGYKADYSWLNIPVLDRKGKLCHEGGVVGTPGVDSDGLYAMGLTYMRKRKSSFICGAEDDAIAISDHLCGFLDKDSRQRQNKSSSTVSTQIDWAYAAA